YALRAESKLDRDWFGGADASAESRFFCSARPTVGRYTDLRIGKEVRAITPGRNRTFAKKAEKTHIFQKSGQNPGQLMRDWPALLTPGTICQPTLSGPFLPSSPRTSLHCDTHRERLRHHATSSDRPGRREIRQLDRRGLGPTAARVRRAELRPLV